jgi:serine phosphatase RsbU (regulator of sigma subunit)
MPSSRTHASREKEAPRNATATVLGIFKKWDCEIGERTLCPGDTFALYTDGIIEPFNEARDEFGEDRLIESLRRHRSLPSQSILDSIVADVRQILPPRTTRRHQPLLPCHRHVQPLVRSDEVIVDVLA